MCLGTQVIVPKHDPPPLVSIHPLPSLTEHEVIVKVQPPLVPAIEGISHVPCDIVLVIDVSSSMDDPAITSCDLDGERTGLTVLDLVKHACRTILSNMDGRDRLALVTFSSEATVLHDLANMTPSTKESLLQSIERMQTGGATNLWAGLRAGLAAVESSYEPRRGYNVPAVMVLTDGKPNHMCPPEGYIRALRKRSLTACTDATIHTFGFGFSLRSGLLKSLAEYSGGNYAFIADAGMIGTTFVHAVAHLQSTWAVNATLELSCPAHLSLHETAGPYVTRNGTMGTAVYQPGGGTSSQLCIPLGNLQCGQSRDICLRWAVRSPGDEVPLLRARLHYRTLTTLAMGHETSPVVQSRLSGVAASLSDAEAAYHLSRARICAFLARLSPIDARDEHRESRSRYHQAHSSELPAQQQELAALVSSLPAREHADDPRCASLLQDLDGEAPYGQIRMALDDEASFERWGQHYLPSLHGAHARQLCLNFKDPGPLLYGAASPLFLRRRDALDDTFNQLPPPVSSSNNNRGRNRSNNQGQPPSAGAAGATLHEAPSLLYRLRGVPPSGATNNNGSTPSWMQSRYNMSSNSCFAGDTMVQCSDDGWIPLECLKPGTVVVTPRGPHTVAEVLVTPVQNQNMVKLRGALVTPWHPVSLPPLDDGNIAPNSSTSSSPLMPPRVWNFPNDVAPPTAVAPYTGCVYSVLLQHDADVDAHAMRLCGRSQGQGPDATVVEPKGAPFWGVTLGHGLVTGDRQDDARVHRFFGNRAQVVESLKGLMALGNGCLLTGGVERSKTTGLATGFKKRQFPV